MPSNGKETVCLVDNNIISLEEGAKRVNMTPKEFADYESGALVFKEA